MGGIAKGCELSGCALIGGETAEMPGMYPDGEYDLAGFAVGAAEKSALIDGKSIQPGDVVLGLASSGAHSNGYSLLRKILQRANARPDQDFHGQPLGDIVMAPTHLYVKPVLAVLKDFGKQIKGLAHITGGGLLDNVPRILQPGLQARLHRDAGKCPSYLVGYSNKGALPILKCIACSIVVWVWLPLCPPLKQRRSAKPSEHRVKRSIKSEKLLSALRQMRKRSCFKLMHDRSVIDQLSDDS